MTDERDPVRWRDPGSAADPVLQRVLGTAQRGLSKTEADALAQRIEHAVRARVIARTQPRTGPWRTAWIVGAGLASIALVWLAMNAAPYAPAATAPSAPAATDRVLSSAPSPPGGPAQTPAKPKAARAVVAPAEARAATDALPESSAAPSETRPAEPEQASTQDGPRLGDARAQDASGKVAAKRRGASRTVLGAEGVPEQTEVPPELQLLSDAQRALRSTPALALELADRHADAYPAGRFAQEREEIAIEALFALGRSDAGRERARVFLARYPRSVQAVRIGKRLASAGH